MADDLTPDICVIGAGPGGLAAAIGAAQEGARVVLVEKNRLGGAYYRDGAVALKALAAAAESREWLRRGSVMGVTGSQLQVNLARVRDHIGAAVDSVAAQMSVERLTALGVNVVTGEARFTDPRTIEVAEIKIRPRRFILATGSTPVPPAIPGIDDIDYLTPEAAYDIGRKPSHLLVLGGGGHGFEIAQAYQRLGVDTCILDTADPLSGHDSEHVEIITGRLRAEGVRIRCGLDIMSVRAHKSGVRFVIREGGEEGEDTQTTIDGSHVIAMGSRVPQTSGLDLAAAGIEHGAQGVSVNARLRTTNKRVFAIGDVVGTPYSAARAHLHAKRVIQSIIFRRTIGNDDRLAVRTVFTDPGIAAVGWSEAEAQAGGKPVRILRYPFSQVDQAQIERQPDGVVKVIADRRGRILGATIVGRGAADLITPWALALAQRLPVSAMAGLAVARPSLSAGSVGAASMFSHLDLTPRWRQRIIAALRKLG
jgi:pyruvate/2-oxoglutarate dehydrogenase complex dihydrolipoamide dehydrogenase (E3) component